MTIAAKMHAALALPCCLGGKMVTLYARVAIAFYPEDGKEPASLISYADAAMDRAKPRARGDSDPNQDDSERVQ